MIAASDEGMLFIDPRGKILKHHRLGHVQNPVVADFRPDLPGLETVSINFWGNQGIVHFFDADGELYHDFEPCQHGSMMLPVNWTGQPPEYWILSPNVEDGGMFDGWGRQGVRVSRRRASRHVRRRAGPDRRLPRRNRGVGPVRGLDLHAERQSQVRPALQTEAQRAVQLLQLPGHRLAAGLVGRQTIAAAGEIYPIVLDRFLHPLLVLWIPAAIAAAAPACEGVPQDRDFTSLWWQDGPPYFCGMSGPSNDQILCFASGQIGLAIDTKSLRLLHAGRFPSAFRGMPTLRASQGALASLPGLALELGIREGSKWYRCMGRGELPKDPFFFPVRFVETGRFLQHVVIGDLDFVDETGRRLEAQARLEIAFWPDRLSLTLGVSPVERIRGAELVIVVGGKHHARPLSESSCLSVNLFEPAEPCAQVAAPDGAAPVWNTLLGCWHVRLAPKPLPESSKPQEAGLDRLDKWRVIIRNDSDRETVTPIIFEPEQPRGITGFTPMLCDPDGTPSGLPVQLSKNWHRNAQKGDLEDQGPWAHNCAFVRLRPKSRRELDFTIAGAGWGGVPAASHAQLCLVGWGHNQFGMRRLSGASGRASVTSPAGFSAGAS